MSKQEFRIEYCGNIQVHHPIKQQAEVIKYQPLPWLHKEWGQAIAIQQSLPLAA